MLDTLFPERKLIRLEMVNSTNTYLQELLAYKPGDGTVVQTDVQTAGKGQRGNTWLAEPAKNLCCSVLYYTYFLPVSHVFYLSKISALAVCQTLCELAPGKPFMIKWPNDVLLGTRKIAGILIENQLDASMLKNSIIGIGLNINQESFPEPISTRAISLIHVLHSPLPIDEVRDRLIGNLDQFYGLLQKGAYDVLDGKYFSYLYGLNRYVPVHVDGRLTYAMLQSVRLDGRLVMEVEGVVREFEPKTIDFILD